MSEPRITGAPASLHFEEGDDRLRRHGGAAAELGLGVDEGLDRRIEDNLGQRLDGDRGSALARPVEMRLPDGRAQEREPGGQVRRLGAAPTARSAAAVRSIPRESRPVHVAHRRRDAPLHPGHDVVDHFKMPVEALEDRQDLGEVEAHRPLGGGEVRGPALAQKGIGEGADQQGIGAGPGPPRARSPSGSGTG